MNIIKKVIMGKVINSFFRKDNRNRNYAGGTGSLLTKITRDAPFMIMAVFAILFFMAVGIFEILFNSPLSDWAMNTWNALLKTSPQSIIDIPNQVIYEDSFMQRTVGEWFGFISPLLIDIISIIFSPWASIFGIIIVLAAVVVRLGGYVLGLFSIASLGNNFAKIASWILLALSFVPLLLAKFNY